MNFNLFSTLWVYIFSSFGKTIWFISNHPDIVSHSFQFVKFLFLVLSFGDVLCADAIYFVCPSFSNLLLTHVSSCVYLFSLIICRKCVCVCVSNFKCICISFILKFIYSDVHVFCSVCCSFFPVSIMECISFKDECILVEKFLYSWNV